MKNTQNSSISVKTGMIVIIDSEMGEKLLARLTLVTADRTEKICKKRNHE